MADKNVVSELGQKIRLYRQDAGLSQEKLAELVGVTFQQIQKYENGKTVLNVIKLQLIAKALNRTIHDFFDDYRADETRLTAQEMSLISSFRKIRNVTLKNAICTLAQNINRKSR